MITLGVMSGTSLDGADAVALRFRESDRAGAAMETLGHVYVPMPAALRSELRALALGTTDEIERMGDASVALARLYAEAVGRLLAAVGLAPGDVAAAGLHGQTIRHRPGRGFTLQLNHPALFVELTGIAAVADFRSRDVAAGGEGAPLVPAFHAEVFSEPRPTAVLNVGGIANLTLLPGEASAAPVRGFDTGPGNMLLDAWMEEKTGEPFDRGGAFAARGRVIAPLLARMLEEAYFALPAPKSTGRERFSPAWLHAALDAACDEGAAAEDVARTLTELTAESVARALEAEHPEAAALWVCGGGALNPFLMARLEACVRARLARLETVADTSARGLDPMVVEAAAFAWLARAHLLGLPGNLPAVTRARGPRILGALYPL